MTSPLPGPLDDGLWQKAAPAIEQMIAAARQHVDAGKYCSLDKQPKLDRKDRHWPWLSVDSWSKDRPRDWSSVFSSRVDTLTIPFDALEAVVEYRQYAESREDLRGRLLPVAEFEREWLQRLFIDHLTWHVYERAMNLGATERSEFLSIYLEAERAVLAPSLSADFVIPLVFAPFPLDSHIRLDEQTSIRPLTDDEHLARATDFYAGTVPASVINSATHALILEGAQIDNSDPWNRAMSRRVIEMSELPTERVERTIRALRVATGQLCGYAQVLLAPHGWSDLWTLDLPVLKTLSTLRAYPPSLDERDHRESVEVMNDDAIALIPQAYAALGKGDKRLNLAARRLDLATHRTDEEDAVIDSTVGLEALIGGDRNEIAHRIATRAAVLLREDYKASAIYAMVRRVYDRRSEIVHGSHSAKKATLQLGDHEMRTAWVASFLLRLIVTEAVKRGEPIDVSALDVQVLTLIDETSSPEHDRHLEDSRDM